MSSPTFGALGAPAPIAAELAARGITEPFPIQTAVIPDAHDGRDVIGRAPTGGGKTLAFGIPLLANLPAAAPRRPTGLVLAPTRELAEQIAAELAGLARRVRRSVVAVYGGVGYKQQLRAFDAGVDLIVACPGRLEDLLATGAVSLVDVRFVVVDEADRMADMGFMPAVKRIVAETDPARQTVLFSATLDGAVVALSEEIQQDPIRHEVGPKGSDVTTATHLFWKLDRTARVDVTADVARRTGSVMVFCRTRHGVDRVARQLGSRGVDAAVIHGGRSQNQRDAALRSFMKGHVQALVATDVAARGVHVDDVAAVVHFDPAEDGAAYIHRSGRTARAGASGVVVSLWERNAVRSAVRLQREVGVDVEVTDPDPDVLGEPAERPTPWFTHRDNRPHRDRNGARAGGNEARAGGNGRNDTRRSHGSPDETRRTAARSERRDRRDVRRQRPHGDDATVRQSQGNDPRPDRPKGEQAQEGSGTSDRRPRTTRDRADRTRPTDRSRPGRNAQDRSPRQDRHSGHQDRQGGHQERRRGGRHQRTGVVVSFTPNGFGFIDAGGRNDLFVHHTNVAAKIRPGQRVSFHIREGRRGPEAVDVRPH